MTEPSFKKESEERFSEPLLPVEKKLIGWSFGIGVVSLVALALVNRFFSY
jgi:hypothetical protein